MNRVWECFVAGLVPTNATDVFRTIILCKDGGTKQERVYTVEGRENQTQGLWGPTNANIRLFYMKVTLS